MGSIRQRVELDRPLEARHRVGRPVQRDQDVAEQLFAHRPLVVVEFRPEVGLRRVQGLRVAAVTRNTALDTLSKRRKARSLIRAPGSLRCSSAPGAARRGPRDQVRTPRQRGRAQQGREPTGSCELSRPAAFMSGPAAILNSMICSAWRDTAWPSTIRGRNFQRRMARIGLAIENRGGSAAITTGSGHRAIRIDGEAQLDPALDAAHQRLAWVLRLDAHDRNHVGVVRPTSPGRHAVATAWPPGQTDGNVRHLDVERLPHGFLGAAVSRAGGGGGSSCGGGSRGICRSRVLHDLLRPDAHEVHDPAGVRPRWKPSRPPTSACISRNSSSATHDAAGKCAQQAHQPSPAIGCCRDRDIEDAAEPDLVHQVDHDAASRPARRR
jgi:hypothetical protein